MPWCKARWAQQAGRPVRTTTNSRTLIVRNDCYSLGCGGGRSRAEHSEANPPRRCPPSQKGLFSDSPQRQSEIMVRPPNPYRFPCASSIVKSPSRRIGPFGETVTFVAMHPDGNKAFCPAIYNGHAGLISVIQFIRETDKKLFEETIGFAQKQVGS